MLEELVKATLARDERAFHGVLQDLSEAASPAPGVRSMLVINRAPPFALLVV
ncbi:MAG: hypothetical protein M3117_04585 [Actinomycetota bacterium]|nr:hypothetical protein [Actinomycetota bacterium]